MKGTYYKTPIDFKALIEKRDLAKTTLETSKISLSNFFGFFKEGFRRLVYNKSRCRSNNWSNKKWIL
ncbi:hypothetical protein [Capnocytophaga leadbetteri]